MKEKFAVSSLLIVESANDKYFIERLLKVLNLDDVHVGSPICAIDDYECLNGLSEKKLANTLAELKIRIEKNGIDNIGILLDADDKGSSQRLALIERAVQQSLDATLQITHENDWHHSIELDIKIACHILNINGKGELETVLKTIKSKPSMFADCLDAWKICLEEKQQHISQKEFDKFWISIYQRYDVCSKREKKQAHRKCSYEASLEKDVWDFSHNALKELKAFLMLFSAS
jgi:hypothetical protein